MRALSQAIVILVVAMATMAGRIRRQESDVLDLSPKRDIESLNCTTEKGRQGLCVLFTYCNDDHDIIRGGNILPNDLREKKSCIGENEWCCTLEDIDQPPKLNVSTKEKCLATDGEEHSWFVALFKSPKDNQLAPRLFCAGALVSSRIVLTAGTCIKSAQNQLLYVQVPASGSLKNYTVQNRLLHHNYNSGTHVNDFGILVLERDVDWGKEKERRVCLDFLTQSQGYCFTVGFAEGAIVATTILSVEKGGCRPETNGTGVSCGTNADSVCIVTPGAPVLCRSNDAVYTVVGVTKSNCRKDKVLIGDISSVSTWFKQELNAINIVPNIYTYNKS